MKDIIAVLDTNVLVSALLSPRGNPAKIYRLFLTEKLKVAYCAEIISEYKDVLSRSRLKIPPDEAAKVIADIEEHGEQVEPLLSTREMVDEDDRVFYDTAKSAKAYLIAGNKKHFPDEPFILTPTEFLERLA
ncbi:hypothetical protein AGMMS49521_1640 [Campylobacterota bacterium]|nr:hypothetical protein AGMMS49521_1640 [Campylobacterota bacterium]